MSRARFARGMMMVILVREMAEMVSLAPGASASSSSDTPPHLNTLQEL